MTTKKTTAEKTQAEQMTRYTKDAILSSKKFEAKRDLLTVLLTNGETYTVEDVETKINTYLTKEV